MTPKNKYELCQALDKWFKSHAYTQEMLAEKLGVSQAHVSKLLNPNYKSYSKSFKSLCIYANLDLYDREVYDPLADEDLKNTLRVAIGDSREKAHLVNQLVKALGGVTWELR